VDEIGSGMFIPYLNLSIPDPGSIRHQIPDPESGSAAKNFIIFNPDNCYKAIGIDPGYLLRIQDPDVFYPGSRGQKALYHGSGSATLYKRVFILTIHLN
jgi:hypothetical protein